MLLALLSCNGPAENPEPTPQDSDSVIESTPPEPTCDSARGELDPTWVELAWDDGSGVYDMTTQSWEIDGVLLKETRLNESARFGLDTKTRIHAFSIQYANLPDAWPEDTPVPAALRADFGNNGFDFWPEEPLWEGTRCGDEIVEGEPTLYVFDEPIEVDAPNIVHVVHQRDPDGESTADALSVAFDASAADDCNSFENCHSALNTPKLGTPSYYNGYSFGFQYDYVIRLYVEVLEDAPTDLVFEDVTGDVSVGSRQAWGDYDNDGWDDLLTNATLYHNDAGTLTEVPSALGGVSASGGVWGDYDNDGCLDLFVFSESTRAGDSLLKGDCAGGFEDKTSEAGITDVQDYNLCESDADQNHQPSPAAAWWDLDNDGDLDVYIPNMICWTDWDFYIDQILVNNGDGTFTDVSAEHGFLQGRYSGRGANPIDADGDGWVDMLVNDYTLHRNLFFSNLGTPDEEDWVDDIGTDNGLAGEKIEGYYGHSIGATWGDLDNDGDWDVVEANLAHPRFFDFSDKTRILLQDAGMWTDIQGAWETPFEPGSGVRYSETHSVPMLADFDQDGALDLVITAVYDGRPTDFYWGNGDGTFTDDRLHAGIEKTNAWGLAGTDLDHDGDQDLSLSSYLLENIASEGHWAQVRVLGGIDSNWAALGSTVRLVTPEGTTLRYVAGGGAQGNQDSMYLHFGLGDSTTIESIEVDFPGGGTVVYTGPWDADQRVWVHEDGSVATGWDWPE
ncbi:MAG: CRTAC1 family protein [Proteobacteria bacterium]|nr:CRTAC1 family protein [Pseudomonadota bacterium]MCP4918556.1 CRTAC1 family protein [Pseudomonadota bacterium]